MGYHMCHDCDPGMWTAGLSGKSYCLSVPTPVPLDRSVREHGLIVPLDERGHLFVCGDGSYGRLGVTHTPVEALTPQLMPPPESNATESEYRGTPPPQRQDERGADSQYVWTPEANRKGGQMRFEEWQK